jgi:hypothetical protein
MPQLYPNPISSTSFVTVNAGPGLAGGGSVPLGGTITLSVAGAVSTATGRNCYATSPTPDGTIAQFSITNAAIPLPAYIDVYVNGLLQDASTYTISGTQVTFTTAPASAAAIYVVYATNDTRSQYALTAIGISTTNFAFPTGITPDSSYVDVFVAGVLQDVSAYSLNYVSGSWSVVFGSAPGSSDIVAVFSPTVFSTRNLYYPTPIVNGSVTTFTIHGGTPVSLYVDVYINGLFKDSVSTYRLNIVGGVWQITFASAPASGAIQVVF